MGRPVGPAWWGWPPAPRYAGAPRGPRESDTWRPRYQDGLVTDQLGDTFTFSSITLDLDDDGFHPTQRINEADKKGTPPVGFGLCRVRLHSPPPNSTGLTYITILAKETLWRASFCERRRDVTPGEQCLVKSPLTLHAKDERKLSPPDFASASHHMSTAGGMIM